jgi:hypothetical protein
MKNVKEKKKHCFCDLFGSLKMNESEKICKIKLNSLCCELSNFYFFYNRFQILNLNKFLSAIINFYLKKKKPIPLFVNNNFFKQ